ncbi:MAG: hypothetical protein H6561_19335 [Lewinellaceae bacterium]|nr:hypothetical protein [Lewinellaceae bacterium]
MSRFRKSHSSWRVIPELPAPWLVMPDRHLQCLTWYLVGIASQIFEVYARQA